MSALDLRRLLSRTFPGALVGFGRDGSGPVTVVETLSGSEDR